MTLNDQATTITPPPGAAGASPRASGRVGPGTSGPWNDAALPVHERVDALVAEMTVAEKVAQLYGVWVGASDDGEDVAPHQHDMDDHIDLDAILPSGLGQLTRPFGTAPVDPATGALSRERAPQRIVGAHRFGRGRL